MIFYDIDANQTENISNIFLIIQTIIRKRTYLNLCLDSWILSRDKFSSIYVFIVISQMIIGWSLNLRESDMSQWYSY